MEDLVRELQEQINHLSDRLEERPIASVSEIAKLFSAGFDGSKPSELNHFIDNEENAYQLVTEPQKALLIKHVIAKITGDAKRILNIANRETADITWEYIKHKLENQYAIKRTFTITSKN